MKLLKFYAFSIITTLIIWGAAAAWGGPQALFTVVVLTLLEITFSADNAVVNSKVLVTLSPFWQKLFLTVGIIIAVFLVRFVVPILIVCVTAKLGFDQVIHLALNDAHTYAHYLEIAAPAINAFGGSFLLLIALSYFIDYEKQTHWVPWLEKRLGKLGKFDNLTTFVMLLGSIVLYVTVQPEHQAAALLAAICAMALHSGLELIDAAFEHQGKKHLSKKIKTGVAGFVGFMYLQVLDASFSLDGVIGAFAITSSVVLIMAGLGAGAVWVRSMTVHLVRTNALNKYVYLEHGAHWAIAFLGAMMWLKLYHIEPPEWIVGTLGLGFILLAILWSQRFAPNKPDN